MSSDSSSGYQHKVYREDHSYARSHRTSGSSTSALYTFHSSSSSSSSTRSPAEISWAGETTDSPAGLTSELDWDSSCAYSTPGYYPQSHSRPTNIGGAVTGRASTESDDTYPLPPRAQIGYYGSTCGAQGSSAQRSSQRLSSQANVNDVFAEPSFLQQIDSPPITNRLFTTTNARYPANQPLAPRPGPRNSSQALQEPALTPLGSRYSKVEIPRMRTSKRAKANSMYECSTCGATLTREADLDRHIETIHGSKYYRCESPRCRHQCNRLDKMKAHIRKKHEDTSFGYVQLWDD